MTLSKAKLQEGISEVIKFTETLKEDDSVPKNIKLKLESIISILNENTEVSLKVGKCLHILDEISEDLNIQPFVRTQIWNISSMLEKLN
ncbi:MAG: hypothetical protein KatS3mg002_0932 [Candidatus Woesearchaeota archaeon]|nr:MAG: hypothetical protein KatS3mg002_0932 [Candidatus Woesearchaeota archaeon]